HGDFLREVAAGDRRGHFGDVPNLPCQVAGHGVDRVGEVLPRTSHSGHLGLAAEFAVRTHFARYAGHLRRKRAQLVDHRVDGVLEFENLSFHVYRDFAGQVAARHGGSDFCNVSHLAGKVAGHEVDVVGKILPRAGHAGYLRLAAQLALRAHFARHARDFTGERVELVDHGVDG